MARLWLCLLLLLCPAIAQGRFENEIKALESRPATQGGTVFIGSSTFTLWGVELEQEFKEFSATNRGFGGSTLPDLLEYAPRVLLPLQPSRVVVYAGTNDLASGRTPLQVREDFQRLVELVRETLPQTQIAFVSLSLPPSRVHLSSEFTLANALVREYVGETPGLHFIDVSRELLDPEGKPKVEFFREDALHMSKAGYERWIPILRASLKKMNSEG